MKMHDTTKEQKTREAKENRVPEFDNSIDDAKWLLGMVAMLGMAVLTTGVAAAAIGT